MKKNVLLLILLLTNLHLFGQAVSIDKLKQENLKLKNQISSLQKENESIQNDVTALKQDTTFLRKEIALCSLYNQASKIETTNTNTNYKFSFISCKGNRAAQQVVVTFMMEHSLPHQDFGINMYNTYIANAYDSQGNNYFASECTVGGNNGKYAKVPTSVPIKITLSFNNFLPGNDLLKVVNMIYNSNNLDRSNKQEGTVEFRNLKITWE